jgi:hypothetical protein
LETKNIAFPSSLSGDREYRLFNILSVHGSNGAQMAHTNLVFQWHTVQLPRQNPNDRSASGERVNRSLPCHTTGQAGPHPAVREVEVNRDGGCPADRPSLDRELHSAGCRCFATRQHSWLDEIEPKFRLCAKHRQSMSEIDRCFCRA